MLTPNGEEPFSWLEALQESSGATFAAAVACRVTVEMLKTRAKRPLLCFSALTVIVSEGWSLLVTLTLGDATSFLPA
jgi:hypothetical protein